MNVQAGFILNSILLGAGLAMDAVAVSMAEGMQEPNMKPKRSLMLSGTFGFTTGEGLVNRFMGEGKVYIQTRNLSSLASALPIARNNKNNGKGGFGL